MTPEQDPLYRHCQLCPRECGVDRIAGDRGTCGETSICRVASSGPHFGEEPCFSGTRGSGTLFFSGCSCGCLFCQNHQISSGDVGEQWRFEELVSHARVLIGQGVHNLNFVTPSHFLPHIRALRRRLREDGVDIPFLYNSSGYERVDRIREIAPYIDLFLPDLKFADPALARTCMGDERYPEIAFAALEEMVRAKGFLQPWDPTGEIPAENGVLVRHLVLPGHVDNTLAVLERLHQRFGGELPLSVMSQYRPTPHCHNAGSLARTLTSAEYERVCERVVELGFEHVFIQPESGDEGFFPDFSQDQPFPGNKRAEK
ncbi:MAG: radical SAM protein [Lentisphaeria bacterium]|nr:radical SAM protein [Lentisphaeria bacterium]